MCPNTSENFNPLILHLDEIYTLKVEKKKFFSMTHCEKNRFFKKGGKEKEKVNRPFCTARYGLPKYMIDLYISFLLPIRPCPKTFLHTRFRFCVEEHKTFCSDKRNVVENPGLTSKERALFM